MSAVMTRRSPLADGSAGPQVTADAAVWLRDFSWQQRFGCKGPGAAQWLESRGLTVPHPANSWVQDRDGILVARLATSEFLVEAMGNAQRRVEELRGDFPVASVYPVIRQDAAFALGGPRTRDLLLQTCSYPFDAAAPNSAVVMTSMVGVGVTIIPRDVGAHTEFRIWCDPSFGLYLWSTLVAIATELGGGVIASDRQSSTTFSGET